MSSFKGFCFQNITFILTADATSIVAAAVVAVTVASADTDDASAEVKQMLKLKLTPKLTPPTHKAEAHPPLELIFILKLLLVIILLIKSTRGKKKH